MKCKQSLLYFDSIVSLPSEMLLLQWIAECVLCNLVSACTKKLVYSLLLTVTILLEYSLSLLGC